MKTDQTTRESNAELLRIICILAIVMHHFCIHALFPEIQPLEMSGHGLTSHLILFNYGFLYLGVNCFVLISGWYGIKTRLSGFINLYLISLFYDLLGLWHEPLTTATLLEVIHPFCHGRLWFFTCYLKLYLLAPLINPAIQYMTKRQYIYILALMSAASLYYTDAWCEGYSILHLIYLYLIGGFLRRIATEDRRRAHRLYYLGAYIIFGIIWGIGAMIEAYKAQIGFSIPRWEVWSYSNPALMAMSIAFFLFMMSWHFQNQLINRLAMSCLGVYMLNDWVIRYDFIQPYAHAYAPWVMILIWLGVTVSFYIFAIGVDQIRIFIINNIFKMKKILFTLAAITLMTTACTKQQTTGIHLENLDTTAVAQNDFYQFACGGWMTNNPLTPEYSRFGSFDKLGLNNLEQVNGLIQEIASKHHKQGSVEQKIGDVYNLAMDTARRDQEGIEPVKKTLEQIEGISSRDELSRVLGAAMDFQLWAMYVDADAMNSSMNILNEYQAGFSLGEKEYYLDEDEHTRSIREAYVKYAEKMFELFGFENAANRAQTVLRLETRLAQAAYSNVELRDPQKNYNKMSVEELQQLVPQVDWKVYFAALGVELDSISIGQIPHLQEAGRMLDDEPLEDLKTLFTWQVIEGASSYLTTEIFMTSFDFYGRVLSGREEPSPLWKRAVGVVNGTLGEAVGQMYVKKYFPEENKARMLALVKNLQNALGIRIENLAWMSRETKDKALEKLNAMTIKIGYPDEWRDYSKLDINTEDTYYANLQRAAKFEQEYSLSFLGKPVDKKKWYMTPQTVNAYYNPSSNEICFPAGILQYPFFDMSADDAFNYGAIGVVIGHEMTHGFDDQGCQFDKDGNMVNWWTEEDKKAFDARTKVMEEAFNRIEVAPGVHANGAFTLGENIADHGGLQVSYLAFTLNEESKDESQKLKERDGFTPAQRFFLAYANVWANNIRPEEILVRTKSDPHSLGRWRVNGALPQINAWYEAWNVTPESPMYIAPENRVSIW